MVVDAHSPDAGVARIFVRISLAYIDFMERAVTIRFKFLLLFSNRAWSS